MSNFPELFVDTSAPDAGPVEEISKLFFDSMNKNYLPVSPPPFESMLTQAPSFDYQPMNFDGLSQDMPFQRGNYFDQHFHQWLNNDENTYYPSRQNGPESQLSPSSMALQQGTSSYEYHFPELPGQKENVPPPPSPPMQQPEPPFVFPYHEDPGVTVAPQLKPITTNDENAKMPPGRTMIYKSKLFTGTPTRFTFDQSQKEEKKQSNQSKGKGKKGKGGSKAKKAAAKKQRGSKAPEPARPPSYIICLRCMQFQTLPLHSHECVGLRHQP